MKLSIKKHEKLSKTNEILQVLNSNSKFFQYPLLIKWINDKNQPKAIKFTIIVPKKRLPKATKRNKIKRRIREAIRLNKPTLLNAIDGQLKFIVIYSSSNIFDFHKIEKAIKNFIAHLNQVRQN